jgi:hypothetical protein
MDDGDHLMTILRFSHRRPFTTVYVDILHDTHLGAW